jgi:hypothetical protein
VAASWYSRLPAHQMPQTAPHVDSTLFKAIARAFRWQKMLETGRYATIKEIAKAEKIKPSYVSRVLRLTLLAPDLVEALVHGRRSSTMSLHDLMKPFPIDNGSQKAINSLDQSTFDCRESFILCLPVGRQRPSCPASHEF